MWASIYKISLGYFGGAVYGENIKFRGRNFVFINYNLGQKFSLELIDYILNFCIKNKYFKIAKKVRTYQEELQKYKKDILKEKNSKLNSIKN